METLPELLEESARRYGVRRKLLEQLLQVERIHIYLAGSSKQSVHERIREIIQEEAKTARS